MTITTGVTAVKREPDVAGLPRQIKDDQSISLKYYIDIETLDRVMQIERTTDDCIELNYPVKSVETLNRFQTIESQFAHNNRTDNTDNQSADQLIDELIPICLQIEEVELPEDPTFAARVRALILKRVRGIKSDKKLNSYLERNPTTADMLGLRRNCSDKYASSTTYSRVRERFDMSRKPVENGIKRLRHMLFRNGIILDALSDDGYTPNQEIQRDSELPSNIRNQAILNYSEVLLRCLVDGISFDRGANAKYTVREVIAAIAQLAIHENFEKGRRLAQLEYQDDIITPEQIENIVRENIGGENFAQSKRRIENLATQMTRNLLGFAKKKVGCFTRPLDIAVDATWVNLGGNLEPEMVPGAMGNTKGGGLRFATGVSYTTMSRFSLGVYLSTDKSRYSAILRRILRIADEFAELGWILADREFNSAETIETFRFATGDTWLIRLKDDGKLINTDKWKSDGKTGTKTRGSQTIRYGEIEMNAYWEPIETPEFDLPFQQEDDRIILITDMPIDETNISEIMPRYTDRWSVETVIRQLKRSFMPRIKSKSALLRLFYLNISSAFYNIYKIMNQSVSPTYGLPLSPRYYEVLAGLADATFQS